MAVKRPSEEIKVLVEKCGYLLIEDYNKGYCRYVIVEDNLGYKYDVPINGIINNGRKSSPKIVGFSNKFTIENIDNWLKINNKDFTILKENKWGGNKGKLIFHCSVCDDYFKMSWDNLRSGDYGCPLCSGKQVGKFNNLKYINPLLSAEWDYERNTLNPEDVTAGSPKKVYWICSICGYKWKSQIVRRNRRGDRCPHCSGKIVNSTNSLSILYPEIASEWNTNKNVGLIPESFHYASNKSAWWKCIACGYEWKCRIADRTNGKSGCKKCSATIGEKKVSSFLNKNNLNYIFQKRFPNCRDKITLPFDFYLLEYNLCIEYHGEQHYKENKFFKRCGGLKGLQKRDKIKKKYCKNNNINLLIIPYWDFDNIEKILLDTLNKLQGGLN